MLSTTVLALILIVTWYRGETQYRRAKRKAAAAERPQAMPRWTKWLDGPGEPENLEESYAEYQRRRHR